MSDHDDRVQRARAKWRHRGDQRPRFAEPPRAGQESVWDYPRPPRLAPDRRHIVVTVGDVAIAETRHAVRVLETGSPPTFYLPPQDVRLDLLAPGSHAETLCEWKGVAQYLSVRAAGYTIENAAWRYMHPYDGFQRIAGYIAFYPGRIACCVDGQRVRAQAGSYYGGWITDEIVGPFKGAPGTEDW